MAGATNSDMDHKIVTDGIVAGFLATQPWSSGQRRDFSSKIEFEGRIQINSTIGILFPVQHPLLPRRQDLSQPLTILVIGGGTRISFSCEPRNINGHWRSSHGIDPFDSTIATACVGMTQRLLTAQ